MLLLLLLLLLGRLGGSCLGGRMYGALKGSAHLTNLTLHINTLILRKRYTLLLISDYALDDLRGGELETNDERVGVGCCELHHPHCFQELRIGTDCNLVAIVIGVEHREAGVGGDGGQALL